MKSQVIDQFYMNIKNEILKNRIKITQNLNSPINTNLRIDCLKNIFLGYGLQNNYTNFLFLINQFKMTEMKNYIVELFYLIHNKFFDLEMNEENFQNLNFLLLKIYEISAGAINLGIFEEFSQELIIIIELFFELISSMFERYFKIKNSLENNNNIILFSSNFTEKEITDDLYLLFIFQNNLQWLKLILYAIEQLYALIRQKNFFEKFSKLDYFLYLATNNKKNTLDKFFVFINFLSLVKKWEIKSDIIINNIFLKNIINFDELRETSNIFFICLIHNILYCYDKYKNIWVNNLKMCSNYNIELIIIIVIYLIDNINYLKFKQFVLDFHSFYVFSYEFIENTVNILIEKMIEKLNILYNLIEFERLYDNICDINPNLLNKCLNTLQDFLVYHLISSFNNDSLADSYYKNSWWKCVSNLYNLIKTYKISLFILKNEIKNKKISNNKKTCNIIISIFQHLIENVNKIKIELPVTFFTFKENFICNNFIYLDYFTCRFKKIIINQLNNFQLNLIINDLENYSKVYNTRIHLLAIRIISYLTYNSNLSQNKFKNILRIIPNQRNSLNYYDIKAINQKCFQKNLNLMDLENQNFDENNKENINYLSNQNTNNNVNNENNSSLFNINNNKNNIMKTPIFEKKNKIENLQTEKIINKINEVYDITNITEISNIKNLNIPISDIKININNNRRYISFPIQKSKNDDNIFSYVFIKEENEEYNYLTLYSKNDIISFLNTKDYLMNREALGNLFSIILYGTEINNQYNNNNNVIQNVENTMKYYDINFDMDYFTFQERLKELFS